MAVAQSFRSHTSSSKVRLHLQTIFSHNPLHRSSAKSPSSGNMTSSSSTSSSVRSSPSSSYSSFGGRRRVPTNDLDSAILSPISALSSPNIRRQPSAIDLALEAERYADEAEIIGLGLLEPRPRANTGASTASSAQCSMMEFMSETMQTPVVLDGIFEVMERA
ncbi:hypothetical protein, variant [Cladophialophora immunda]|uniref:Uncharacterized protein n=1 Tax=Cladophialophora immunda TaxID=569365 RepID=A0A0D1ZSS9_9EURO|nr:hypothetical protein, variant [Cladophialophora immunda]KIW31116.1 hypothetical protein, variant [Cladophialophora immunda]OQV00059.1 hypothetical protein CLAIMM_05608 [Cladophialophora immunda]